MSSPIPQRKIQDIPVGAIGYGAMMLTWRASATEDELKAADEENFAAIRTAVDAGSNFINSGQFYGPPTDPTANLKMLKRFYDKYPEYIEKTVLSVKGGMGPEGLAKGPIGTVENLRRDLGVIKEALGDKKSIDIYEMARVDPQRTIEESIGAMLECQKDGLFKHIGVSEIAESALRRAAKIATIAAVEIEVSVMSIEEETTKVIKAAEELGIAIIAYSPLGRGFVTGRYQKFDDLPQDSILRHSPRFQHENFAKNLELVEHITQIAKKKGVTNGQVALAYVLKLSSKTIPIPGSSSTDRTLENIKAANVELSPAEFDEINDFLKSFEVAGGRYPPAVAQMNWGTGKI